MKTLQENQKAILTHEEMVFFLKQTQILSEFNLKVNLASSQISFFQERFRDVQNIFNVLSNKRKPALKGLFDDKVLSLLSNFKFLGIKNKLENIEYVFFDIDTFLMKEIPKQLIKMLELINEFDLIFSQLINKLECLDATDNSDLILVKEELVTVIKKLSELLKKGFSYMVYLLGDLISNFEEITSNVVQFRNMEITKKSNLDEIDEYLKLNEKLEKLKKEAGLLKMKSGGMKEHSEIYLVEIDKVSKGFIEKMTPYYSKYGLDFLLEDEMFK